MILLDFRRDSIIFVLLVWFHDFRLVSMQVELEEAVRKGNEKLNAMMVEQLTAQEKVKRAAEVNAKVYAVGNHSPHAMPSRTRLLERNITRYHA